jgi:hypothetical protein
MLKNLTSVKEVLCSKLYWPFPHQVSPALLLDASAGNCQRGVVDELQMNRNQMGKHNRS